MPFLKIFSISLAIIVLFFIVFHIIVVERFFRVTIVRKKKEKKFDIDPEKKIKWAMYEEYRHKTLPYYKFVTITNRNGVKLSARYVKQSDSKVWVIDSHGFLSNSYFESFLSGKTFFDFGYNILGFDHVAHGDSEGDLRGFAVLDQYNVLEWIDYLKKTYGDDIKIILFGVSMGTSTNLYCANKVPSNVKAIIADCGFTSPYDQFKYTLKHDYHLPSFIILPLLRRKIMRKAHFDIKESTIDSVKNARCPILYISGDNDTFVPMEFSFKNYENTSSEKELVIFEGAIHAQSYQSNPERYLKVVHSFLKKYIK